MAYFPGQWCATIKLLKGLSFRSTVGMRYQTRRNDVFYGDESITGKRSSIQGSITNLENSSFQNFQCFDLILGKTKFMTLQSLPDMNMWKDGHAAFLQVPVSFRMMK